MVLHMLQPTYIKSILVRYGMQDSRPASTPMVESFFANLEAAVDTTVVGQTLYQHVVVYSFEDQTRYLDSRFCTEQTHKSTNKLLPHGCQASISVFTRDSLSCP
jgi:hypothetical protein